MAEDLTGMAERLAQIERAYREGRVVLAEVGLLLRWTRTLAVLLAAESRMWTPYWAARQLHCTESEYRRMRAAAIEEGEKLVKEGQ